MRNPVTHLPDLLGECDNTFMQKSFYTAVNILAAGALLLGNAYCLAQETPAATTQPASPPKTQKATTPRSTAKPGASGAGKTQTPLALKTQKDKFSYALGMNLGANLHKQSVPVDPNIMARGLKDALAGGKTLLTEEEARVAITTVQNDMREKQQAKMQAAGGANKKEGEAFLADNKSKEGVIALPSGLQYKVLKEGNGPKPTATDSVVCNYRGTLINGTNLTALPSKAGRQHSRSTASSRAGQKLCSSCRWDRSGNFSFPLTLPTPNAALAGTSDRTLL